MDEGRPCPMVLISVAGGGSVFFTLSFSGILWYDSSVFGRMGQGPDKCGDGWYALLVRCPGLGPAAWKGGLFMAAMADGFFENGY